MATGWIFLCLVGFCSTVIKGGYGEQRHSSQMEFYEKLFAVTEIIERKPALQAEWNKRLEQNDNIQAPTFPFNCIVEEKSQTPPESVHRLKPGDIDVVAAFGDSITAGNGLGARRPIEVALENRGESWLIGGDRSFDEGVITLPNILKKFNPKLKGYSTCVSPGTFGLEYREWFNLAQPGHKSNDLIGQATELVRRMRADSRVDFQKDWKLVSIFVGGNDLCASCDRNYTAARWKYEHERTLIYLRDNLPRTMINLISMFDVTPIQNLTKGFICELLQWRFCDCARNLTIQHLIRPLQLEYHEMLKQLADDSRFHSDNFTVVLQSHMRDLIPPEYSNGTYIRDVVGPDCFHPSRYTHQAFSAWLFNTMLIPVGQKPVTSNPNELNIPISCPTEQHPFIFTNQNSIGASWPTN